VPNHSEVDAFNPGSKTTCSYIVPGNDNDVIGLAIVGVRPNSTVWFAESNVLNGDIYLDGFNPDAVGDGCPGTTNESYPLAGSMEQVPWPGAGAPAQIAVDPSSNALWVTDWIGSAIYRFDTGMGTFTSYPLATRNASSTTGAIPWQILSDGRFVYAIDYGDDNLVRISESSGIVDEVPLPVTSDTEQGYGLALSGGKLYFTLSDDDQPSFGAASTLGYVDIGDWETGSAVCPAGSDCDPSPPLAVVYKLPSLAQSDLRGIAVGSDGSIALADLHQIVRVSP
jgi:DNA-binding beta-propeller fold protein YncE